MQSILVYNMDPDLVATRRKVQKHIEILLRRSRFCFEWSDKLPEFSRKLETRMFQDTASKEEYMNMTTALVELKLQGILRNIQRNSMQLRRVSSSSAVRTMIPTPCMPHSGSTNSTTPTDNSTNGICDASITAQTASTGNMLPNASGSFNASNGTISNAYEQPLVSVTPSAGENNMTPSISISRQQSQNFPAPGLNIPQPMTINTGYSNGGGFSSMDSSLVLEQSGRKICIGSQNNHVSHRLRDHIPRVRINMHDKASSYRLPSGASGLVRSKLQEVTELETPEAFYGAASRPLQQHYGSQHHQAKPSSLQQKMLPLAGNGYANTSDLSGSRRLYSSPSSIIPAANNHSMNSMDLHPKPTTHHALLNRHASFQTTQEAPHFKSQTLDHSQNLNFQVALTSRDNLPQNIEQQQFQQPNQPYEQLVQNQQNQHFVSKTNAVSLPSVDIGFGVLSLPENDTESYDEVLIPNATAQYRLLELQSPYQQSTSTTNLSKPSHLLCHSSFSQSSQQILRQRTTESQNEFDRLPSKSQPDALQQVRDEQDEVQQPQFTSEASMLNPVSTMQGAAIQASGGVTCGPKECTMEADYRKQVSLLLFLLHARKCSAPEGSCREVYCVKVKQLWLHMDVCNTRQCGYPRCCTSKRLVNHYLSCRIEACPLCVPAHKVIASARKARDPSASNAGIQIHDLSKNVDRMDGDKLKGKRDRPSLENFNVTPSSPKRMKSHDRFSSTMESSPVSITHMNPAHASEQMQHQSYQPADEVKTPSTIVSGKENLPMFCNNMKDDGLKIVHVSRPGGETLVLSGDPVHAGIQINGLSKIANRMDRSKLTGKRNRPSLENSNVTLSSPKRMKSHHSFSSLTSTMESSPVSITHMNQAHASEQIQHQTYQPADEVKAPSTIVSGKENLVFGNNMKDDSLKVLHDSRPDGETLVLNEDPGHASIQINDLSKIVNRMDADKLTGKRDRPSLENSNVTLSSPKCMKSHHSFSSLTSTMESSPVSITHMNQAHASEQMQHQSYQPADEVKAPSTIVSGKENLVFGNKMKDDGLKIVHDSRPDGETLVLNEDPGHAGIQINDLSKIVNRMDADKLTGKRDRPSLENSNVTLSSPKCMKSHHSFSSLTSTMESSPVSITHMHPAHASEQMQHQSHQLADEVKTPSIVVSGKENLPVFGNNTKDDGLKIVHNSRPDGGTLARNEDPGHAGQEEVQVEEVKDQAVVEVKQDVNNVPSNIVAGVKPGKPKSKGVSLTELFTPEQIKEHIVSLRQWVGQSKAKAEKNQAMELSISENSCQLCAVEKLTLEPPPVYCTPCGVRIRRYAMYHTMASGDTRYYICTPCYNVARGNTIYVDGSELPKARLDKRRNDEATEESWVQCDKCEAWQHQICALFNGRRNDGGQAEYTCPNCLIEEIEKGERTPLPQSAVLGAKDLPRTILSDHLEQRLAKRLKEERLERARQLGKCFDEVPGAEALVVRVVSSVDKKFVVQQHFLDIFEGKNYPTEFQYKSKVILLFQKIEGVEVCLFGMYVQEYGSECQSPNQRMVYLSYLDSVKYFRPEIKTVTGEALRTFVYHEILLGYLEYCKKRGFTSCYIWACPPIKCEDYILYCHPDIQKTPKSDKLREWYLAMLRKAMKEKIVANVTNLYDHFFVSEGECKAKVTAARLPYFDGDYWPGAAEDMIKQLRREEDGRGQRKKEMSKKNLTKRSLKAAGQDDLSANASMDALLMQRLGKTIYPMKEDFIMVHFQHSCTHCCILMVSGVYWVCDLCKNFKLCQRCYDTEQNLDGRERHPINSKEKHVLYPVEIVDVPSDTKDKDEILESEFFDTRHAFLSLCQGNHYQYNSLRRAKHSSMMVLYHLHNPTVSAFVTTCGACHNHVETGEGWRCEICPDFDVCNACYQKDGGVDHPHKLTHHPSIAERDAQNQEALQIHVLQPRRMLDLLVHASQCRSLSCQYPNCRKFKGFFHHATLCKIRASRGCLHCKKIWHLLHLHARTCKESQCLVPRCNDLKEHLKRLQQQSESRRRAAVMEMMRERAADVDGSAG